MFGKRSKPASTTVIAAGSAVEGKLLIHGAVQIDGAVNGAVIAEGSVTIGKDGRVLGEVEADTLSVAGRIDGIVRVRGHLHVLASGQVQGHARYASLEVERGGVMDGSASRAGDDAKPANDVEPVTSVATDAPAAAE